MIWQTLLGLTSFAFLVSFGRHVAVQAGGQVLRVRGIPSSMALLYSPDQVFECLDGSLLLPFTKINDDYCDCGDGSDEPGTAACTNGSFYCQNTGYQATYIPSSWVNDGVCDCCDASDEYSSNVQCVDICHDLGREAWLEAQRIAELTKEGNKIRLEYISKGKQIKTDNQAKLAKLRIDLDETELIKKERENEKLKIEELETAALEKYKPAPQPEPEADAGNENANDSIQRADTENESGDFIERADAENDDASYTVQAERYFKVLDTDESGTVTVAELQVKKVFDKNRDGVVSKEEALFFLNNNEEITQEEFVKLAWPNVKPYLMLDKGLFKHKPNHLNEIRKQEEAKEPDVKESGKPESNRHQRRSEKKEERSAEGAKEEVDEGLEQEQEHEEEEVGDEDEEVEQEEEEEEEEEDDEQRAEAEIQRRAAELEEGDGQAPEPEPEPETTPEPPPQYDEETQMIVDEASKARERYQETEREVQDLLSEIRKLEERAERDYGHDEEFATLDGQCFEYSDLEYIYSLCPYGRTSQRSKNGGSEVSLGHWSDWVGPQGNRYSAAKFDRGLTCWNGPARTCHVHLRCGVENKLLQVSEPSRCEYAMEFATPALCNPSNVGGEVHDEL